MSFVRGAVEEFEQEFAAWQGVAGGVATGFGRSALALALDALAVRGGDVLVPDFICRQVPEAVQRAGGRPVFYRVARDLTVSLAEFEAAFTSATRAAVVAHYFGRLLPEIRQAREICRKAGVVLIEDCALALEASAEGRRAGTFGDAAVFSFTKSGWGYGGGMVSSNSLELLARMRALREKNFERCSSLSFRYGLLRRTDFAANRPALSRTAERTGRWLERLSGLGDGNFYDAGRFDAALPAFAARHARRMLSGLCAATARRHAVLRQLTEALGDARPILLRPEPEAGDAASFLLVQCPSGRAERWVARAAQDGVTLRRCWPAYQPIEHAQTSRNLTWLAEHLLVLEIHPQLTAREVERIAQTLRQLAEDETRDAT